MANRVNPWEKILKLANKDLNPQKVYINVNPNGDGSYNVEIVDNGNAECYADGYYEDELGECINDAWAHARAKAAKANEVKYSEVKCTHHEDGFWLVDGWHTNDQSEEGEVIAVINDITGDYRAIKHLDNKAKKVIETKRAEIAAKRVETLAKITAKRVETLAEIYNDLSDSEKDEFLRMTGNE